MNIEKELTLQFSKTRVKHIADIIGADEERFAVLMRIFLQGTYVLTQKAAWVLSECAVRHPFLIIPYFRRFIDKLHEADASDAVKRNVIRVWQYTDIPEEYTGEVYDICFGYLNSNEAIAIRAFSVTVCYNIARKLPELKPELRLTLEDLLLKNQDGSPAIKSRGKKILAELKKK
ncbi:hypothetical protein [Emticicia fluvialis]|uniref:hypothetical protein n=1 Tax=Emticicia fluvialis TaxID=2974474 RepID=UPI0021657B15|nr:hypothetical protein [Emticicia fluvialis]